MLFLAIYFRLDCLFDLKTVTRDNKIRTNLQFRFFFVRVLWPRFFYHCIFVHRHINFRRGLTLQLSCLRVVSLILLLNRRLFLLLRIDKLTQKNPSVLFYLVLHFLSFLIYSCSSLFLRLILFGNFFLFGLFWRLRKRFVQQLNRCNIGFATGVHGLWRRYRL